MQLNFQMEPEPQPSGVKARMVQILGLIRFGYQLGFIPWVVYLGTNSFFAFISLNLTILLFRHQAGC